MAKTDFLRTFRPNSSEVLDQYRDGTSRAPARPALLAFAGKFLGAIYEDGALVAETLSASTRLEVSGCLADGCGALRRGCFPGAKIADQFLEFGATDCSQVDILLWVKEAGH
jgi:hypothetical protein